VAETKDPNKEKVSEADAGVQRDAGSVDELRTGLATGTQSTNPDQPDGHVTQTTVVPLNEGEPSTAANTVLIKEDGKKGPAA
jgi:hypothetical protein